MRAQGIGTYGTLGRNGRHRTIDVSNITKPDCSDDPSSCLPRQQSLYKRPSCTCVVVARVLSVVLAGRATQYYFTSTKGYSSIYSSLLLP